MEEHPIKIVKSNQIFLNYIIINAKKNIENEKIISSFIFTGFWLNNNSNFKYATDYELCLYITSIY